MTARETLDKLNAAMMKKDNDTAMMQYSEDAELITPEGSFKGREQIMKWFTDNAKGFSGFEMNIKNQVDADDKAVDEWEMKMKHTGTMAMPGFGESIPATNKDVTMSGCDIVVVKDGMIVSHHTYYDQKDFADQLGIKPE